MASSPDSCSPLGDSLAHSLVVTGLTPGSAIGVVSGDTLIARSTGIADVVSGDPVQDTTRFQVGSISKVMTAAAVLRLGDRGELDVDAPVLRYLPWFEFGPSSGQITSRHLMMHTAGLPFFDDTVPSSRLAVWSLRNAPPGPRPGASFHYSNLGYMTLGHLLEAATGTRYPELMQDLVFGPLGMTGTVARVGTDDRKAAAGHQSTGARRLPYPVAPTQFEGGHASVCAPARDVLAFVKMLLAGGRHDGTRFLSPGAVDAITGRGIDTGDATWQYACGMFTGVPASHSGHRIIQHGGQNPGFEAALIADVDASIGVVAMVNSHADPWPAALHALESARAGATGKAPPPPPQTPSASEALLEQGDVDPGRWGPIVGTYRSHAPLLTEYRVVARNGIPVLQSNGIFEQTMTPLTDGVFRVGDHPAEQAVFDVIIEGCAQRVTIGGGAYARVGP